MSTPPIGEAMWALLNGARKAVNSQSDMSQTDRTLAAITLIAAAVVVGWPRDRVPMFATRAGRLGQDIWDRRSWFSA